MKIVFTSDTHAGHRQLTVPNGDVLIHGGDVSNGSESEVLDFIKWFAAHPHPYKIFIGGNMDYLLEKNPQKVRDLLPENIFYLENESVNINGIHIYGSPMIPRFVGAFNVDRGTALDAYWQQIPADVDILLTHTPPHGILDTTSSGRIVGCQDLKNRVEVVQPQFHLFGHVHESYGKLSSKNTTFINASYMNIRGGGNPPFVFEI